MNQKKEGSRTRSPFCEMEPSDNGISFEDVCTFLDAQPGLLDQASTAANGSGVNAAESESSGASHVCSWPGCGKGFSSRWSLERHAKHHTVAEGELEPKPDSFVERRLRERLKSVHQALEKAREKLAQQARQQEQADAELREVLEQSQQQKVSSRPDHRARVPLRFAQFPIMPSPSAHAL